MQVEQNNEVDAFFASIKEGERSQVDALLRSNPQLINARGPQGVSPLLYSLYFGHRELGQFLASRDNVELNLFEAAALNDVATLKSLLASSGADIDACAEDGFRAIGLACFFGARDAVEFLLASGADANSPSNNPMKVAPIHSAAANRDPEKALDLTRLLLAAGVDVNAAQNQGWTPLQQAAMHGQLAVVKLLVDAGADVAATADDGSTAKSLAEKQAHEEVVNYLASLT